MTRPRSPEKRESPRQGAALRVVLEDREPPTHATTRNISLGGMYLMTATKTLDVGSEHMAKVEIDRHGRRWSPPLPIRVVWSSNTSAGAAFANLTAEAIDALREALNEARARHKRARP